MPSRLQRSHKPREAKVNLVALILQIFPVGWCHDEVCTKVSTTRNFMQISSWPPLVVQAFPVITTLSKVKTGGTS